MIRFRFGGDIPANEGYFAVLEAVVVKEFGISPRNSNAEIYRKTGLVGYIDRFGIYKKDDEWIVRYSDTMRTYIWRGLSLESCRAQVLEHVEKLVNDVRHPFRVFYKEAKQ